MATKMAEREEILLDLLKEAGKKGVKGSDIDTLFGITSKNRSNLLSTITKKYPKVKNISKSNHLGGIYAWVEEPTVIPMKELESKKIFPEEAIKIPGLNHEGYTDPTPKKAIDKKIKVSFPKEGEIWRTVESNGTNGYIFVLNSLNGAAQCIKLYQNTTENQEIVGPDPFNVTIKNIGYIGDPTHATFKPLRYCVKREMPCLPKKLKEARDRIAEAFGIKIPVAIPQVIGNPEREKALEEENKKLAKAVDKWMADCHALEEKVNDQIGIFPDPVIPEGYIDQKTVAISILTEERNIWKEVATKLLDRGQNSRDSLPF